jgi:hypothetical protein
MLAYCLLATASVRPALLRSAAHHPRVAAAVVASGGSSAPLAPPLEVVDADGDRIAFRLDEADTLQMFVGGKLWCDAIDTL